MECARVLGVPSTDDLHIESKENGEVLLYLEVKTYIDFKKTLWVDIDLVLGLLSLHSHQQIQKGSGIIGGE